MPVTDFRMLGFSGVTCYPGNARFGRGSSSSPIWMDNLNCNGDEEALDLCYFPGWGIEDCSHYEDAGLVCSDDYGESSFKFAHIVVKIYHEPHGIFRWISNWHTKQCPACCLFYFITDDWMDCKPEQ